MRHLLKMAAYLRGWIIVWLAPVAARLARVTG